jgi:hypothetical protein
MTERPFAVFPPSSFFVLLACLLSLTACLPDPSAAPPAVFDLKPPMVLEAGPVDETSFVLRFDEDIAPVEGSFALSPGKAPRASAEGEELRLALGEAQEAGRDYVISGEVRDEKGNGSRFLLDFSGFNPRPAKLRISEVQTSKNSSLSRPHRDYVEFEVLAAGNLGGMEFSATSSTKTTTWRFPGAEVAKGEVIVLHCAPEGLVEEKNETGGNLALSGGIDASGGRDFWSKAGALPDASGVLAIAEAPEGRPMDGLFYADGSKTGALGDARLGTVVEKLIEFGLWESAGVPAWEDAFVWKPSSSRSILRRGVSEPGAGEWTVSVTGGQSPGRVDPLP